MSKMALCRGAHDYMDVGGRVTQGDKTEGSARTASLENIKLNFGRA